MPQRSVILDTNIFVAAGFNRSSSSARILKQVREGSLPMSWNRATRRETEAILKKIPPLSASVIGECFREEHRFDGTTEPERFAAVPDPEDRKFAALSAATGAVLITNDRHLLDHRDQLEIDIATPAEYWDRHAD